MSSIFLIIVISYAVFVGLYFLYLCNIGKRRKKSVIGRGNSYREKGHLKVDIMGKSKFKFNHSKPLASELKPLASISQEIKKEIENTITFASSNEVKVLGIVSSEELDILFSDTSMDEKAGLMDIDYPLEYELSDEEEERDETCNLAGAIPASGVTFEELGNMVHTIDQAEYSSSYKRQKAGETLLEIRRTDLFEQLVSGKPDAKRIVAELMEESLTAYYLSKDKEIETTEDNIKVPDSFSITDFI
jgi:hypothetical protein